MQIRYHPKGEKAAFLLVQFGTLLSNHASCDMANKDDTTINGILPNNGLPTNVGLLPNIVIVAGFTTFDVFPLFSI
jgi:hypothetical protein